jgi:hypothetical protein
MSKQVIAVRAVAASIFALFVALAAAVHFTSSAPVPVHMGAIEPINWNLDISDASTLQKQIIVGLEQEPLPALDAGNFGALTWQDSGVWGLVPAAGGGSVDLGTLLAATRVQYWSGSLGAVSGETPGLNCLLSIGNSNVQPQDAITILGSSSRGFAYSAGAGPYFLGSYLITSNATGDVLRGNAAGIGGFKLWTRFGIDTLNPTPLIYAFAGMIDQTQLSLIGSVDFTTQTSVQAVGCASTQTASGGALAGNWKIVSCDGSATTSTDSGLPITVGHLYELQLVAAPDAASITWTLLDITASTSTTGSDSTHLPAKTMPLGWTQGMTVQSGGSGGTGNVWSTVRYMLESNY